MDPNIQLTRPRWRNLSKAVWIVSLNLLAFVGVLAVLYASRMVIEWVFIALLLALALAPLVKVLVHAGLARTLSVLIVFLSASALLTLFFVVIVPPLLAQGEHLVSVAPDLVEKLRQQPVIRWSNQQFGWMDQLKQQMSQGAGHVLGSVAMLLRSVVTAVAGFITVVFLTLFMLLFGPGLLESALEWLDPPRRHEYRDLAERIYHKVGRYVMGTLSIAAVGGVAAGTLTAILGMPFFLPLGAIALLLGLVPYLGSVLSVVLLGAVGLATHGWKVGLLAAGAFVIYQQLEAHILQPLVQRQTIRMNPLVVSLVLLIGTSFEGIIGAMLALPIAGALQVLVEDALVRRKRLWKGAAAESAVTDPG